MDPCRRYAFHDFCRVSLIAKNILFHFFLVIHKQSDEYVQFEKWAEKMTSFNQEKERKKTFANFCVCFGCFRREG